MKQRLTNDSLDDSCKVNAALERTALGRALCFPRKRCSAAQGSRTALRRLA
jgi:hypothetical protein